MLAPIQMFDVQVLAIAQRLYRFVLMEHRYGKGWIQIVWQVWVIRRRMMVYWKTDIHSIS